MNEVLKKIGFTDAQIADLSEGKDVENILKQWEKDNEEVLSARLRPAVEKEIKEKLNADALKAVSESLKHKIQKVTGITVPGGRGMEIDAFLDAFKVQVETGKDNGELEKQIKKANDDLSDALEKLADMNAKLSEKDKEIETTIAKERSKMIMDDSVSKFFAGQEWGVSKELVEFAMDNLKNKVHSEFNISDGVLKTKDGAPVVVGNTVVKSLPDWLSAEVDKLNLRKKNDGRQHQRDTTKGAPTGKPEVDAYFDAAMAELVS